jgi:hypothetical protein
MRLRPVLRLVLFASLLSLPACASNAPAAPDGPLDVSLVLAPGETKGVVNTNLAVRFDRVLNDSRCPGDAICITGGDAIVQIRAIVANGPDASYDLHTGNLEPARHSNVTIALAELSPYPFSSLGPIKPGDYRATLRITR